jgi:transcriptional regulator with XRE-family HTH domain
MKLTQQQLAEALGVTAQHISAVEKDKRAPSLDSLARLAEELGVTVDFLVTGKEGVITDTIPAIRADKKLNIEMKRALITLIRALYTENEEV